LVTLEAHGEGSHGLFMGGVGGVFNVFDLAVANLALAGSGGGKHSGGQVSAGLQRTGRVFNFGAQAVVASRQFGDIAGLNGDPIAQLALNANAGLSLGQFGSIGSAYTAIDRAMQPGPTPVIAPPGLILPQQSAPLAPSFFLPAQHSRIVTATYTKQIGDVAVFATGFRDFANRQDSGFFVGLTIPLGSRSSATVSAQSDTGRTTGQVQLTQTANTIGDWGYNVLGAVDHPDHEFAQGSYMSPWALVFAGADRNGGVTTTQAEARGALSFVDGGLFASNRIDDAFAVVDTDGVGGIRVDRENRPVGTTDSSGRFLVPDLRSFDVNRISIDPLDAPLDAVIPTTVQQVRPQDRSGVVVHFPVKSSHGALIRLVDEVGKAIPVGSVATLKSSGVAAPVGYDGEAYIVDLQAHNEVGVERRDGRRCSVEFDYQQKPGQIETIGPLRCRAASP
jgi:outer membrane usher protein